MIENKIPQCNQKLHWGLILRLRSIGFCVTANGIGQVTLAKNHDRICTFDDRTPAPCDTIRLLVVPASVYGAVLHPSELPQTPKHLPQPG
jgi:hypothetical protein